MSEPFLAEITIVGFTFAPRGYALCDGQILPINQNQSLYSLLGTTYGGDGRTTFALPDLRGRTPMSPGTNGGLTLKQGEKGGEENHTLLMAEMPQHTHNFQVVTADATQQRAGFVPAQEASRLAKANTNMYKPVGGTQQPLAEASITSVGANQSHNNMCPWVAVNFCIALQGTFPSRN
jgi:microcystin-dependent protein